MVFESVVVDLLNKVLGDYVENLDKSQLKLGIWGGDVVLQELDLKETALDDLDLPVKIKAGHLGKLTLKIPWKNLYTEPVIATVDGVYALAVPNVAIKYDAVKEEKAKQEAKQKKLQQLEDAKKLEAEKDKPKEKKKDSFAEKFATQVIKNLQVEVRNIHIRYEDRYTDPKNPFSIGVTLKELLFQTTDEHWKPCIIKEAVSQIYKLVKLESLSVYWNSKDTMFDLLDKKQILNNLKNMIASEEPKLQYLLKPVSSVAHLRINTKPDEQEYRIPKIFLTVVFDEISLSVAKVQYNDVLEMLESFERMNQLSIYRKYRPDVPFTGHVKTWWHYSYASILEETVRRRRKMWSWDHIKKHRTMKHRYREAYVKKLDSKKVATDVQATLDECEKYLDVFNITVIRQQAEVEAAKLGAKRALERKESGWFGGFFGGGKKKEAETSKTEAIKDQFYEQFTAEEKAKLYEAIGYQENEADLTLPKEFVAVRLVMKLNDLSVSLKDDRKKDLQILKLQFKNVFASVGQRPAANAVQVDAKMDKFTMLGAPQGDFIPKMVKSQTQTAGQVMALIDLKFETNPLDGLCDTRVHLNARPLQIVYDAITVNSMADFFKPPDDIYLKQLSQAAMSRYEKIKEQSAAGLQHAMEIQKYTEITVDLKSSYIIVPHGGMYKKDVPMLILDLGNLKVNTEKSIPTSPTGQMESVEELMKRAYDKFNISVDRIQVLFSEPGIDWQAARVTDVSPVHILLPISINVVFQKSMFANDVRMAKMKLFGELPLLSLSISDYKLQKLLALVESIPFPDVSTPVSEDKFSKGPSAIQTVDINENRIAEKIVEASTREEKGKQLVRTDTQETVNATDMELFFVIKKIKIILAQKVNNKSVPLLKLVIDSLGTEVKMRTYDMCVSAYLGGIYLQYLQMKEYGMVMNLINTPLVEDNNGKLLTVTYLKANTDNPEFATMYKKIEQDISIVFASLEVLLHQEAILALLEFAKALQPPSAPGSGDTPTTASKTGQGVVSSPLKSDKQSKEKEDAEKRTTSKKKSKVRDPDIINIKVNATLNMFGVSVCTEKTMLTNIQIKGINTGVTLQSDKTLVTVQLKDMTVLDPSALTQYPKILQIEGTEVLNLNLAIYNDGTADEKYSDMSCVDMAVTVNLGRIKVVFLNKFVMDLLDFLNHFQAAQKHIMEAGEVAAQMSREVVQNFQEKASRLSLNVQMKAPVIIVPQNSQSTNVLLADFGHLYVRNSFELARKTSASAVPAVLEKMKVELTDLKLSRAVVDDNGFVKAEVLLIEPVTITVGMCRNLSAGWYKDAPDVDISATMEKIKVSMSQGDFTIIMKLLNENLTEGQTQALVPSIPSKDLGDIEPPIQQETSTGVKAASGIQEPVISVTEEVRCTLKFFFQMKSLTATLYGGESILTLGIYKRDINRSLGQFEMHLIAVEGHMMSNNTIETKVILKDMILDDKRPVKKDGITRFIQKIWMIQRSSISSDDSNMVDISFKQDANKDKKVEVTVISLHICVCLEFLMDLADFFIKGMPESSPSQPQPVKKEDKKAVQPVKQAQTPPEGEMRVALNIGKPEIILIEDQTNLSSNVLVLNMELMFNMRVNAESQEMSAAISGLEIVSSVYEKMHSYGTVILSPCYISCFSKAPTGQGAHMDIGTSDLIMNISPATIRTISAIIAGLSRQVEEEGKVKEKIPTDLWAVKSLTACDFWFLKSALVDEKEGKEQSESTSADVVAAGSTSEEEILEARGEQMILKVPNIVVKIEGGVGKRTVPLLIVEASFQGEVQDWSGQLNVESCLKVEVAYFNEILSVWEPVLEPVWDSGKFRKWELQLQVKKNDDVLPLGPEDELEKEEIVTLPPKMSIDIHSQEELQLTMSKTCLDVLTKLGKAFGDAYNLVDSGQKLGEITSPYVINNYTGLDLVIKLDNAFEIPPDAANGKVKLMSGEKLPLENRKVAALRKQASVIKTAQDGDEKKMIFQIEKFNATREVTIKRAEKRLFLVNNKTYPGDTWSVVCSTDTDIGQKIVNFRSNVQVRNHLAVEVEVLYTGENGVKPCGMVAPEGILNLPLHAVYNTEGAFYFCPQKPGYRASKESISWRGAENTGQKLIICEGEPGHTPFFFNVCPLVEDIYFEAGVSKSAKNIMFHLHPTVVLHNLLPHDIRLLIEGTSDPIELKKGQNIPLDNACVGKTNLDVTILNYMGTEWMGNRSLDVDIPELSVWNFESYEGSKKTTMELGLHVKKDKGTVDISIYSPYWMINKSGKTLLYKSGEDNVVEHPAEYKDAMLFSFRQKNLFGKKKAKKKKTKEETKEKKVKVRKMKQAGKASLKIGDADWSDKFSLDTVGSSGTVECKSKTQTYEVGVSIVLSHSGLTKLVTFTPYYMIINTSEIPIVCTEVKERESILEIQPGQCVPFWPMQSGKEMKMEARFKDTNEATGPFLFNKAHETLLKLDNEYGGISVECQETEAAMVTTLTQYRHGLAPVLLVNHTNQCFFSFQQSGVKTIHVLMPVMAQLYAWEDSLGKRELIWTCGEMKDQKNDLSQDGIGEFFYNSDTKVYWVSFLDGMQRVLLLTEDLVLATLAQEAGELEQIEQEINLKIHGLGLSLVNADKETEVAYIGITSSGIIWEEKKRKRFKALDVKSCIVLETAFQKYQLEIAHGNKPPEKVNLENKMEVSFADMLLLKPNKRAIQRSFQDGIWVQYKTSPHQLQFHAKINKLQLDNQTNGPVFQTVLAPMPPPKSVAADSVPKPFTEVSLMVRKHEHSKVSQVKYFKVLVQEMQVKVDQGFLNSILELFSVDAPVSREQETEQFGSDCDKVKLPLLDTMGISLAQTQKSFYDYLHLSPLKIHLSFSLQGGGGEGGMQIKAHVLNVFLQSVGVVLTDVQDVVFKLGFFERNHKFYNQSQLVSQMSTHYAGQAIKQMYVLVLGLDVLGNPFGLLRGMAEGIEDLFYEPYQGAIQGPEEFAEGLALGVRSLFGHAVGGAAGAVSRITGTLGKGLAALTLDDEYQKKRREAMNKRPANVGEGLARGGKGLVMGVFDGVTGIVLKPIEGAQKEGVEGFFKGIGKGLVGVVTRPTSGVIDFASSSFEGIKRIAEMSVEIHRLRPPRRFHKDGILRPYNLQEAEGCSILIEIEKGIYLKTDEYIAHVVVTQDKSNVFLVTDKRVLFASRGDIFGQWEAEFTYTWAELKEKPKVSAKGGVEITLKEKEKKKFSLLGGGSSKKEIHITDKKLSEWIVGKIHEAMDNYR
ncbi:hypothetical protein CHS0354_020869 [Potamilus streckersoni]|uniref:Uncharacterized protein n=1 Tax=Potamilus streckersoni TaxID=2493646 RepID=A0AAE0SFE7_9BIVA|nr:hypothetical protein CHS0354_020869 [Potamilus streckersoni]